MDFLMLILAILITIIWLYYIGKNEMAYSTWKGRIDRRYIFGHYHHTFRYYLNKYKINSERKLNNIEQIILNEYESEQFSKKVLGIDLYSKIMKFNPDDYLTDLDYKSGYDILSNEIDNRVDYYFKSNCDSNQLKYC